MRVHFKSTAEWKTLNEELAGRLGLDLARTELRLYPNAANAVYEAVVGLRRLYTLKKTVYFIKDQDPHFSLPLQALSKEGLQVVGLPSTLFTSPAEIEAFTAQLTRESHFLLYAVDDPLLGKTWPAQALEDSLRDKNILKIRVSYARHMSEEASQWGQPHDRNLVRVFGLPDGGALSLLGERTRFPNQGVELLHWSDFRAQDIPLAITSKEKNNPEHVRAFEAWAAELGAQPFFPGDDKNRLWDRAVMTWTDMDGHALIHQLAEATGQPLRPPGQETRFETLSLSRWGGLRAMDWLNGWGYAPEQIRGTVILDAGILTPEFQTQLRAARQAILELQNGRE